MMKHEDMITLIGNMFINAYVAGDRKDLDSFRSARADRDRMFDAVRDLYAELEHESYEREQFRIELKEADDKIKEQQLELNRLNEEIGMRIDEKRAIFNGNPPTLGMKLRLSEIYGSKLTDPDNPDSPLWSDYAPGPEDMEPELRDCMPFPDVEEMAPAEEVDGANE